MKPYSMDLRERVRAALHAGALTQPEIAAKYDIRLRTVENWVRQLRETSSIAPKARRHGPTRTLAGCEPIIRKVVQMQPDITLSELCVRVTTETNVQGSPSMMCRELQHLNLPRKK